MFEVEFEGEAEFYAPFISVTGSRGTKVLLFCEESDPSPFEQALAERIGELIEEHG